MALKIRAVLQVIVLIKQRPASRLYLFLGIRVMIKNQGSEPFDAFL